MFTKILIANRGEIACRIIATARRMGIATVAVYSEADAHSRHVELADEAYAIGPAPARQSYLRGDAIIDVACRAGAQAIHPGYGFLSENADFAEACATRGIVFIGPPPAAIRAMGSKSAAKTLMERSGVPLVPGYHGDDQDPALLRAQANRIGYPVLLKASAGGGGRGMRVVTTQDDFSDALDRAKGEALASFGDDRMLVEKYLTRPRHIEVQVFGDTHGTIVSLFERDCSIQRRHQKVLEESPAPHITADQRQALGAAAIAAARAVDYVGAGTVEFIYEDGRFYFMEMNTRLQVEHPVTEYVTGQDLVEWQLLVATGQPLPLLQNDLHINGHAIEARICAEDPERDFMPAAGPIIFLREPTGLHVRLDSGFREGDTITPHYDSMIAKLIVWGADRPTALARLSNALQNYELIGPRTNLDLLRRIAAQPAFAAGDVDTGFIARHHAVTAAAPPPPPALWAAAALAQLHPIPADPSPWGQSDGWRLNGIPAETLLLRHGDQTQALQAHALPDGFWRLDLPTGPINARLREEPDGSATLEQPDATLKLRIVRAGATLTVIDHGTNHAFTTIDRLAPPQTSSAADAKLTAPTPSRVISVFVAPGETVAKGQKLLILESMKVETTFTAPRDGVIETVLVNPGELVAEGARLVTLTQSGTPKATE